MTYQVQFTELNNPAKTPIVVQDQSVEQSRTSLKFVGKNYAGYGQVIAEDFLHLLENFSAPTPPANPIQGQLWYDTVATELKIYDGTNWNNSGSLKKATTAPAVSNSLQGDIWVDTANSQMYLFSGSNWLLVGPQFSQGTLTGPVVENIIDTSNITHSVVSLYSANASSGVSYRITINSKDTFTPKLAIPGFAIINQGVNLSTLEADTGKTKFWGIAEKADALLVNGKTINSSNFLRGDVDSLSNFPISIRSNGGISVGSDLSFNLGTNGNSTVFYSKNSGNTIQFNLNNNGVVSSVLYIGSDGKVGVGLNNTAPPSALGVAGSITSGGVFAGTGVPGGITINDGNSPAPNILLTANPTDGFKTSLVSTFNNTVNTFNGLTVNNIVNGLPSAGAVLLPGSDSATGLYDIGSASRKFRNIYAQSFVGTFNGSFTGQLAGSVNGSAAKLSSPTSFSLTGDVVSNVVSFDGQSATGTAIFTTTISANIISNKQTAADTNLTDQLLIYRPNVGLLSASKATFFNHVATIPIGSIITYAGNVPPAGYLLCDGSEVKISNYPALFAIIGYTYRQPINLIGQTTFALPDLRGRFALGRDNMNNNLTVPYKDGSGTLVNAGGGVANRVSDPTSDVVGASSGSQNVTLTTQNLPDHKHNLSTASGQYYAAGLPNAGSDKDAFPGLGLPNAGSTGFGLANSGSIISSKTSQPVTTMNPYLTINYLIFTGVL